MNKENFEQEKKMLFTQQQFNDAVNAQAQKRAAEMKQQYKERIDELDALIQADKEEHHRWMKWSNKADIVMVILGILTISLITFVCVTSIIGAMNKAEEDNVLKDSCIQLIEDYL